MQASELTQEQLSHITPEPHRGTPFEELPEEIQTLVSNISELVYIDEDFEQES